MLIRIYTDGACSENPGPGGWAAIFCREDSCIPVGGYETYTTNNRMELLAIIKALCKVRNLIKDTGDKYSFELYSDSAYVVNAINKNWITRWKVNGWKTTKGGDIKNKDLWCKYMELIKFIRDSGVDIKILKVKGHNGNAFNEYADKVAKEQCEMAKIIWRRC